MATLWLSDGVYVKVVQERLGHATAAFTLDYYGHAMPGMQDAAAEQQGARMRGRQPTRALAEDATFDFENAWVTTTYWCKNHGREWCEAVLTLDS